MKFSKDLSKLAPWLLFQPVERPASAEGGSVRPEDGKDMERWWGMEHIYPLDVFFPSVATPSFD